MKWILNCDFVPDTKPTMYGFVYLIEYTNGQLYVGKKCFWSFKELDALKNGNKRENHLEFKNRRKNGKIVKREIICKESDWRKYTGSCKETKGLTIKTKEIIGTYSDKINLTYGELEELVKRNVLRDDRYLNANIMGKFYEGKII